MKKQISKISLKTDKIVNLSKNNAQAIVGGQKNNSKVYCVSDLCSFTCPTYSC
ncbi:MAG: class I lanthipeptide [Spirosomataceae bacterium]